MARPRFRVSYGGGSAVKKKGERLLLLLYASTRASGRARLLLGVRAHDGTRGAHWHERRGGGASAGAAGSRRARARGCSLSWRWRRRPGVESVHGLGLGGTQELGQAGRASRPAALLGPRRVEGQDGLCALVAQGCCSSGLGEEKDRLGQGDSAQEKGKGISPFFSKGI